MHETVINIPTTLTIALISLVLMFVGCWLVMRYHDASGNIDRKAFFKLTLITFITFITINLTNLLPIEMIELHLIIGLPIIAIALMKFFEATFKEGVAVGIGLYGIHFCIQIGVFYLFTNAS